MSYRSRASFTVAAKHRDVVYATCRSVQAFLQSRHPDVSLRYFVSDLGDLLQVHLDSEADDLTALVEVRDTTASDPQFAELGAPIARLILEAESQIHPSTEI